MAVVNLLIGAPTPEGATFAVTVDGGGPVRVAVATDEAMTAPTFTSLVPVNAQGVAKVSITGLAAGTRHFLQVEDNAVLDVARPGRFLTLPPVGLPASFTIGAASCSGLDPDFPGVAVGELDPQVVSNHTVYNTIRDRALAENWPLFANLGDWGYPDWGTNLTDTLANRRTFFNDLLGQPRQRLLWDVLAKTYNMDDHDFAGNNSNGTYALKINAATVHRERIPSFPLPDPEAMYWSTEIGRVLLIGADVRYNRSPNGDPDGPDKTMLGVAQKAWMDSLLADSTARLVVWLMPQQWLGTTADSWASFQTEQAELVTMFVNRGYAGRVCILSGDYHGIGLDNGANSAGGIPVLQCASIDSTPGSGSGGTYSAGTLDGRGQYGTVQVTDLGSHLVARMVGWRGTSAVMTHQFTVTGDPPPALSSGALVRTLRGSHLPLVEARLVTGFQTGDDPDGDELDILGGGVRLDGTAQIQRSANLTTDGRGRWPRRAGDPLMFGNEIFLRRGVDLGGAGKLWITLGYYRIYRPRQQRASEGPITLQCYDRMSKLIDAKLLAPREFKADRTIRSVFEELVGEVYPAATILFDQNAGMETLGRAVTAERERYQFLKDIADSLGRIMFWDDQGFLRVEFAPDPGEPVWDVFAGAGGVQVEINRELDLANLFNAVVAIGEGHDDQDPVRAVAIDANPRSLTFFHPDSQVGERPFFLESPLLNGVEQASTAAFRMLQRNIGMPYKIDFTSVVDPSMRPYQPGRVRYSNGDRERHLLETLHIPLEKEAAMSGTTRNQTLAQVQV